MPLAPPSSTWLSSTSPLGLVFPGPAWKSLFEGHPLCSGCQSAGYGYSRNGDLYTISDTLPGIRQSRREGCSFCKMVHRVLIKLSMDEDPSDAGVMNVEIEIPRPDSMILRPWFYQYGLYNGYYNPEYDRDYQKYALSITQGMSAQPSPPSLESATDFDAGKLVHGNLGMAACVLPSGVISFVQRQLANCLSNPHHALCNPGGGGSVWPKRVLEVSKSESGHTVTLVEFDPETMPGEYAALSYCWGDQALLRRQPPYKADSSTLATLQSGISVCELPLTLQHAIEVCSWIDVRYIWIDSLCILQDSASEWQAEAAKMGTVYSMAKLTIIAATSPSCHGGFLNMARSFKSVDLGLLAAPNANLKLPALRLTATPVGSWGFHQDGRFHDVIDHRGWVYQEEALASRYVKFTDGDIQWKCTAGMACTCGQQASREYTQQWGGSGKDQVTAADRWGAIVGKFHKRIFTNETDRLLALSSLARKLAPHFPWPPSRSDSSSHAGADPAYIAGLWRSQLLQDGLGAQQLAWYLWGDYRRGSMTPQTPSSYIAPSFSWASLNAIPERAGWFDLLLMPSTSYTPVLSEVVRADRELVFSGNEFGAILPGASLSLRGPLLPCTLESSYSMDGKAPPTLRVKVETATSPNSPHVYCPAWNKERTEGLFFECLLAQHTLENGEKTVVRSETGDTFEETDVSVLLLGVVSGGHIHGIVLGRQGTTGSGYHRIAFVKLNYTDNRGISNGPVAKGAFSDWVRDVTLF